MLKKACIMRRRSAQVGEIRVEDYDLSLDYLRIKKSKDFLDLRLTYEDGNLVEVSTDYRILVKLSKRHKLKRR
jgi:hypothetical protein